MQALSISNLKKQYADGTVALNGVTLAVEHGDFFGLLGPNGAGKSTTIGIIATLVTKSSGQVEIYGHDLDKDRYQAKFQLGLVPQEFNFNVFESPMSILINQAGYYGIPYKEAKIRATDLLKKLDLWSKAHTPGRMLSGGMKRRLMIARGLINHPKLLILDEPTAGVDIELRRFMWEFLKDLNKQGTTIILTTHYLEEAEQLCKNVAIINKGELIENSSVKLLVNQLHVESYVLDIKEPLAEVPKLDGYSFMLPDPTTLEVSFQRSLTVNQLFQGLSELGCHVLSMRNKVNRLEELFLSRVSGKPLS
ncbi:ABC transporter ATP-binding protein [Candidatus Berkiella cookevillensis]|uniref:ABC transporter ATP-binding protein n=1 Tax=Candidatus Berkiella cookevillensis TaxID=437022 RepID=A0A0Q9YGF5_9GAMM|nr:ABC transporter ATP-binding protein [Candidatus Berkiella cookevillensis]MCS5707642.1 ABC transporter ATP-binding protein [Candidatus Berkiella cookevillensis]